MHLLYKSICVTIVIEMFIVLSSTLNDVIIEQNRSVYIAIYDSQALAQRHSYYPIHPLLLSRFSPRGMTGEQMTDDELLPLFEAARWSPSSFNVQPWNFVYARPNTKYWQSFLSVVNEENVSWCQYSSAMVIVISNRYETYKGNRMRNTANTFDTASACMALSLEGAARGYAVREIGGFDHSAAAELMNVTGNDDYAVELMIAIGKRPTQLTKTFNETITQREPIQTFVSEGVFNFRQIEK